MNNTTILAKLGQGRAAHPRAVRKVRALKSVRAVYRATDILEALSSTPEGLKITCLEDMMRSAAGQCADWQ